MKAGEALAAMRRLPVAGLDAILGGRRPLVLAPHADDESLGSGGLLAQAARAGMRPGVLVLTDGTGSHPGSVRYPPARLRAVREAEARAAVAILGVEAERVGFLKLRDTAAPVAGVAFEAAVTSIVQTAHLWGCGVLAAPWRHDPHCDHEAGHLMAVAAAARGGLGHLAYPVWGWTLDAAMELAGPDVAGWRLDVTGELLVKERAIGAHRSQYAGLVDDDPGGFQMEAGFMDLFAGPFETFLSAP
jgi:LmbE family N-acetylglucosaminyl deacetylase